MWEGYVQKKKRKCGTQRIVLVVTVSLMIEKDKSSDCLDALGRRFDVRTTDRVDVKRCTMMEIDWSEWMCRLEKTWWHLVEWREGPEASWVTKVGKGQEVAFSDRRAVAYLQLGKLWVLRISISLRNSPKVKIFSPKFCTFLRKIYLQEGNFCGMLKFIFPFLCASAATPLIGTIWIGFFANSEIILLYEARKWRHKGCRYSSSLLWKEKWSTSPGLPGNSVYRPRCMVVRARFACIWNLIDPLMCFAATV